MPRPASHGTFTGPLDLHHTLGADDLATLAAMLAARRGLTRGRS